MSDIDLYTLNCFRNSPFIDCMILISALGKAVMQKKIVIATNKKTRHISRSYRSAFFLRMLFSDFSEDCCSINLPTTVFVDVLVEMVLWPGESGVKFLFWMQVLPVVQTLITPLLSSLIDKFDKFVSLRLCILNPLQSSLVDFLLEGFSCSKSSDFVFDPQQAAKAIKSNRGFMESFKFGFDMVITVTLTFGFFIFLSVFVIVLSDMLCEELLDLISFFFIRIKFTIIYALNTDIINPGAKRE